MDWEGRYSLRLKKNYSKSPHWKRTYRSYWQWQEEWAVSPLWTWAEVDGGIKARLDLLLNGNLSKQIKIQNHRQLVARKHRSTWCGYHSHTPTEYWSKITLLLHDLRAAAHVNQFANSHYLISPSLKIMEIYQIQLMEFQIWHP